MSNTETEKIPHGLANAQAATAQTLEWVEAHEAAVEADDRSKQEEVEQAIQEDPLSIEWGAWTTKPHEVPEWDEVRILLTTGGPALRLIAALDGESARLEWQDWGTPWTEAPLTSAEEDAWIRYVRILGVEID